MAKTIVFKEKFEKKLKKLRVKIKFVNNVKKQGTLRCLQTISEDDDFESFVASAFKWVFTPEGYLFWENIAA